ncbi:MAG: glycogen synthase [Acidimicrobiia bacterium]
MRVLFATAELSPLVSVGGLAHATSGLVRELRDLGTDVDVVVPDYFSLPLVDEVLSEIAVPGWAAPAVVRDGVAAEFGPVTLVRVPGIERPNPYVDEDGHGWPDNPDRFFAFSAAVAALARDRTPDILHCNDWHTAAALGLLETDVPTVFTIHTLGYQGWTSGGWLDRLTRAVEAFESYGGTNPLAGAVQIADRVITVSPTYADEIRTVEGGSGLHEQLSARGDDLIGILNGIDESVWNPEIDPAIDARFSAVDPSGKAACRADLLAATGWPDDGIPIVAMVTRLVHQKGIELALEAAAFAEGVPFRLAILGSGERWLADWAEHLANLHPDRVWFREGYHPVMAHRAFAGADLLLVPSRFEPCGLSQMQAMAYGTIPVVTSVGGLVDTVIDADVYRKEGNGFVAGSVDTAGIVDALHRAVRAWKQPRRRAAIQRRGMARDWSWTKPAKEHIEVYRDLLASGS